MGNSAQPLERDRGCLSTLRGVPDMSPVSQPSHTRHREGCCPSPDFDFHSGHRHPKTPVACFGFIISFEGYLRGASTVIRDRSSIARSTTNETVSFLKAKLFEIHGIIQDNENDCEAGQGKPPSVVRRPGELGGSEGTDWEVEMDRRHRRNNLVLVGQGDDSLMQCIAELEVALMYTNQDMEIERVDLQQEKVVNDL
ncbi:hypothetical protein BKA70DRAFT_1419442 [Coprinopsis sp. MPI-PUGE-AT-0042]|nr:hypothetical protein BKA70DRAFT_1419442 [Coprinopsis sp. MPI-PUGE-AT-0042]